MKQVGKRAATTLVAGVLVAGGLFAGQAVFASGGGAGLEETSAVTAQLAQEKPGEAQVTPARPRPFARAVHADVDVQYADGTRKSFDYDKGQITSIGEGTVTFIRRDGKTVELSYDDKTRVREKGEPGAVADLEVGDIAMFFSHEGHADIIRCIRSPEAQS